MNLKMKRLLLFCSGLFFSAFPFNPREYRKQFVTCKAAKRNADGFKAVREALVDITMSYVDINPNSTNSIIMVHGWPGLWSTWSYQIEEFKNDYHLIVVDHRGFGESTHPGNPRTSASTVDMTQDLICVLENAGVKQVICMGHDWGSQLCYDAARLRPDIFTAVISIVVPYISAGNPFVSSKQLMTWMPRLAYQVYFDNKMEEATTELDKDIRRTLRATLRSVASPPPDAYLRSTESFLDAYKDVPQIPPIPFMAPDEEDYLVEQYSLQGFGNTLEFYTQENRMASWQLANDQRNFTLPQPVLAVYPAEDVVADWLFCARVLKSHDYIPKLKYETMEGSHWAHLEYPVKFNRIVRKWLKEWNRSKRVSDEL